MEMKIEDLSLDDIEGNILHMIAEVRAAARDQDNAAADHYEEALQPFLKELVERADPNGDRAKAAFVADVNRRYGHLMPLTIEPLTEVQFVAPPARRL